MSRAPFVTILFFAAAAGALIYGFFREPIDEHLARAPVAAPGKGLAEERRERVAAMARSWPREPGYAPTFNALDPAASGETISNPSPEPAGPVLPDTEGRDLVEAYCGSCHTLDIVVQQHATQERWDYTLDWMVREQNMPELPAEDRNVVLDYLVLHFGAETAGDAAASPE